MNVCVNLHYQHCMHTSERSSASPLNIAQYCVSAPTPWVPTWIQQWNSVYFWNHSKKKFEVKLFLCAWLIRLGVQYQLSKWGYESMNICNDQKYSHGLLLWWHTSVVSHTSDSQWIAQEWNNTSAVYYTLMPPPSMVDSVWQQKSSFWSWPSQRSCWHKRQGPKQNNNNIKETFMNDIALNITLNHDITAI